MTPTQFPMVIVRDDANGKSEMTTGSGGIVAVLPVPRPLTSDQIVGKYFRDAQGNRGVVIHQFDQITYFVLEFHEDRESEERLRGIDWLRTMRFFETEIALYGDADSFFLGAQMEGAP